MKKAIAMLFLICSLCFLFTACSGYEKGNTFSEDFLRSVSLEGMPKPECEKYSVNKRTEGQESLKMEISLKGFEAYINSFVDYMSVRDDIYYFGIQESDGMIAEMVPHFVSHRIDGDFKWESGHLWYTFIYSLTSELDGYTRDCHHAEYKDPIIVKFDYDKEKGVAFVVIITGGRFATECIDKSLLDR